MGVNKVILLGNLGADPELRHTQSQNQVCTLRIATTERRKGQDGQWTDHTEWHSVVTWGKTAENCAQYLKKGRQVFIEGKLQTRKWQDKNGENRYTTEIVANAVQFVGGREGGGRGQGSSDYEGSSVPSYGSAASYGGGDETLPPSAPVAFDDDDIPF